MPSVHSPPRPPHLPVPEAALKLSQHNLDLARLRRFRNRGDPDWSLSTPVQNACKQIEREHRSLGGIGDAWVAIIPPHLARHCEVVGLVRGTLTIRTADASTRFQLDRFLRTGGQNELARSAKAAIRRVKLL